MLWWWVTKIGDGAGIGGELFPSPSFALPHFLPLFSFSLFPLSLSLSLSLAVAKEDRGLATRVADMVEEIDKLLLLPSSLPSLAR